MVVPEVDSSERESLLLRGTLDLCVLALLDREPTHAYGVVQRLQEHGFGQSGYGTVYPLVSRLRRQGLLDQAPADGDGGPPRQVLSLTGDGRAALRAWTDRWRDVTRRVTHVLEEGA